MLGRLFKNPVFCALNSCRIILFEHAVTILRIARAFECLGFSPIGNTTESYSVVFINRLYCAYIFPFSSVARGPKNIHCTCSETCSSGMLI